MHHFFRILSFAQPYKKQVFLSVIFSILTVIFSLVSITTLIPVLKIIFDNTHAAQEVVPYDGLLNARVYLQSLLNYKITNLSDEIGRQQVLFYVLIFAATMFILKNLTRYLGMSLIVYIRNGIEKELRNALHQKVLHLPVAYFSEKRKGDIMARLTTDIGEIQWAVLSSVQRLVQDPLMIILTLGLMIILSPKLTLFVILLIPVSGFVITFIGNSLKKPSEKAKEELGKILSLIDESLLGLPIIKSYVAEDRIQEKFEESNQKHFKFLNKMMFLRELSSPISEVIGSFIIIVIIWYGSSLILDSNEMEPEIFITYIALFYQIINPAKSISLAIYDIKRGEASSKRILSVLDTPNPLEDVSGAIEKNTFEDKIEFENISFSYEDKEVVRDFSLTVPKGKTIALVGQSGSGKSTIAKLMSRFYDVNKGVIKIDGIDLRKLKIKSLRKMIGYISQDAILFHGSIENNLRFGNENATEAEMIQAAKIANAHDFITATENKYETNIGDSGQKLSGGQRQRLTIARAILKNPPILILDEATSALDSESEKLVQEALEKLMKNRTSIVIAHRLSTIQHADLIIVMKEGKIIEQGRHQELLEKKGEYFEFVRIQTVIG